MARSRHGRSGGRASSADPGLPSWAQRHLDEAGDTAVIPAVSATAAPSGRRQHRAAAGPVAGGLRGWGVAIVSVAAAVGAVPLAVSSLANDHSNDPLPRVDTYTAGRPGPLPAEPGTTGRTRPGTAAPQGDQATAGVLDAPPEAPAARVQSVSRRPAAAVVRPTPAVVPPVAAAPRTVTTPPATGQGRSATPTTKTTTTSSSKPPSGGGGNGGSGNGNSGGNSGGGNSGGGVLGGLGNAVGGVTRTAGGLVNGLVG